MVAADAVRGTVQAALAVLLLTALVPGNRAVHRTPAGLIVGPEGEVVRPGGR
jgi:hypothetical protein